MPVSIKNSSYKSARYVGTTPSVTHYSHQGHQFVLPLIVFLLAGLGWFLVYIQFTSIHQAVYQTSQTTLIQRLQKMALRLETNFNKQSSFQDEKKLILKEMQNLRLDTGYQAWIYSEQEVIYDPFWDHPINKGQKPTLPKLFETLPDKNKGSFQGLLLDLKTGQPGYGFLMLDPKDGKQICSWTPLRIKGHLYQVGLRVPLKTVLSSSGINRNLFYSVMLCVWGSILSFLVILAWLQQFRFEKQILTSREELEQKVIERTRQLEVLNGQLMNDMVRVEKAEKALRESEKKYRLLVETTPNGILFADMDYDIQYCNQQAALIAGYSSPEQMLGLNAFDIIASEDSVLSCRYEEEILEKGSKTGIELWVKHSDGRRVPVELSITLTRDESGQPVGFTVVSQDITERKQQQEVIRDNENRLKLILSHHPGLIWVIDQEMRIIQAWGNPSTWKDVFLEKIIGKNIHDVLKNADFSLITGDHHYKALQGESVSYRYKWKDQIYDCHLEPMRNVDGIVLGVVGVAFDVTEKIRMEEELIKAGRLDSLGYLAAGIAHDFNNILTGILGNISMVKPQETLNKETLERLEEAERVVYQARNLTNQLLTFAKGGEPVKKVIHLEETIEEMALFSSRGSNCICTFNIQPGLPAIYADQGQLGQVVHNLVLNAIQAMPQGGEILLSLKSVELTENESLPLEAGNYLLLSVKDQGIGINNDILPKIFDPFFTNKPNGTGLGLSTSYSIISRHKGHILVQTTPGKGTAFLIYLPVSKESSNENPASRHSLDSKKITVTGYGRILVMEDDPIIQKLVVRMLEKLGYQAEAVKDGEEAFQYYRQGMDSHSPYRAVIMDLTIPGGMGGKEAILKIKEIDPAVCAIVSSGYSNDPVMAQYQEYGFANAISKPFQFQELAQILQDTLPSV